jgi:hypothetical protein
MPDAAPLTEQEIEGLGTASEADSEDSTTALVKGLTQVNAKSQRLDDLPYKGVHRSVYTASERAYRKLLIMTKKSELVRRKPENGILTLVNAKAWTKLVPITKLVVCNWSCALLLQPNPPTNRLLLGYPFCWPLSPPTRDLHQARAGCDSLRSYLELSYTRETSRPRTQVHYR